MLGSCQDIVDQVEDLIGPPELSLRINECLAQKNNTLSDIVVVLEADPVMSARVMRIANSAFYAYQGRIDSLHRALMLIGLNGMRDLVWACESISRFNKLSIPSKLTEKFWNHSLFVALGARILAGKCKTGSTERIFTIGLLHDIGLLPMWQLMPEQIMAELGGTVNESTSTLSELETVTFGFNHFDVGAGLLAKWKLPASITHVLKAQSTGIVEDENVGDLAIIQIANHIAQLAGYDLGHVTNFEKAPASAWQRVGLSERIVEAVMQLTQEIFNDVKASFLGANRDLAA